jgi:dipeptidyl aminopeptidase/acylaminoacyl peptidase
LVRAFVVASDGRANRIVKQIPDDDLNAAGEWSNDGTRLFVSGCHYGPPNPDTCADTSALVHIDGIGPDVRIETGAGAAGADGTTQRWSPDDGTIVTTMLDAEGRPVSAASLLWDPMTGRSRPAPWTGGEDPSWQRLAP